MPYTERDIDKNKFVQLHCHNSFSFKDGIGAPQTRVDWATENNKEAVATTNHGNIADWIAIYQGTRATDIKAALGCEFYFKRGSEELIPILASDEKDTEETKAIKRKYRKGINHVTMFAKNATGFYNMIKLHNEAWMNRFYFRPIVSEVSVEKHHEGIICLSGCSNSEINWLIKTKHYLQSEQRQEDVKNIIKQKIKLMTSVFKTKNIDKLYDDANANDFDVEYFNNKSQDKLDQSDYIKYVKKKIQEKDVADIESTDEKVDQLVDWWHNIFGDDFYIEIMTIHFDDQKLINQELIGIAKKKNIPLVVTNDSHYLTKAEAAVQELQMLSDQKATYEDLENDTDGKIWTIKSEDLYFKDVDEMYKSWETFHKSDVFTEDIFWEGIYNVTKIVDKIEKYEVDTSIKMPKLYDDGLKVFTRKISEGMKTRDITEERLGKELYDVYMSRLKRELRLIKDKGYIDYFLIVDDIIRWAKEKYGEWSVGPGRGSAAGSLITYLIGVTNIDPIKHDLMFERFLDPARDDLPDIDTDFEPRIRDAVVEYMIQKFGRDNTSNIGTYGMLKTKSAILDVARVFGIPAAETMNVTKFISSDSEADSLKEIESTNPDLKKYLDKWQDKGYNLRFFIEGIRGSVRQPSMHAAGLLVSNVNLAENIALMRTKKGIITAWQESGSLQELSDLGFAKMDILGLLNLQVMNDAAKLVKERHDTEIDWSKIDLDDPEVYKNIVQTGDAMGLFQFEAGFVINMLRNIKPRNFEQFAAISALLRPGPLHMGMDKEFARRVNKRPDDNGNVWTEEDIPEPIRDILAPTLGILVYQEQYMKIAEKIGGFSVKETNKLRKDLTKGGKKYDTDADVRKKIDNHKKKFVKHASEFIGQQEAENWWSLIFSFAAYGFNKSHSISYTYISFYEAWLKYYYMPEFYAALFNNTDAKKEKKGENVIAQYLTEAMKKGFRIHIPNVNESDYEFAIRGDKDSEERFDIVFGLAWIKNLSSNSIENIIKERKKNGAFSSIDDFFDRMDEVKGRKLNKKDIEALVWSGAFDSFLNEIYEDRFDLHEYIFETVKGDKKYTPFKKSDDMLIEKEYESINISMKEIATFAGIKKELEDDRGLNIDPLFDPEESKGQYLCVGKITKLENKVTRTGKDYVRISLRDESTELRMVYVWPWKCNNWEDVRYGQTIIAHILHDDSGFKNLTGWSLVNDRSEALIEAEEEEKEKQAIEEKKSEDVIKSLESLAKKKIVEVAKKFKDKYKSVEVTVDKTFEGRPNAIINVDCGKMNGVIKILVFYYTDKKGFSVKDLRAFRNGYDYLYIIRNDEEDAGSVYLFKTKDFKSNLLIAPKDSEGLRYPIFNKDESLSEQVLLNTIANKITY